MLRQEVLWTMLIFIVRQSSTFRFEVKDDNRNYRATGRAIDGSPSKIQHLQSFYIQAPMGISKKNEFPAVQNKRYIEHSSHSAMNNKYFFPKSQYDKHHIETKYTVTRNRNNDASQNEYKINNDTFLLSIQEGQPPIKFYSINCNAKASCSSIIPAPDFSVSTSKPKFKTSDETKNYLRSLNLQDGFRFSKSPTEDLVSKMFKAERKARENKRRSRTMKFKDIRDRPGFWPGSQYRPRVSNARADRSDRINLSNFLSPHEKYNHKFEQSNQLSYLRQNNFQNIPTKRKPLKTQIKYSKPNRDGEWRRYSKATVSKLDTETGEWNRVSRQYMPKSVLTGNQGGTSQENLQRPTFHYRPMHGNNNFQKISTESSGTNLNGIDLIRNNVNADIAVNPRDPANLSQLLIDSKATTTTSTTTIPTTTAGAPIALPLSQTTSPVPHNDAAGFIQRNTLLQPTAKSTETLQQTGVIQSTTSTTTTTQKSVFRNPQAMAAAVGAGLIPATFAAVLPVMFGRRRRRRSLNGHHFDKLDDIFRIN